MANLNDYYYLNYNHIRLEGHTQQSIMETECLKLLSAGKKKILEIGFNAGHSSETFLSLSPDSRVTSFDIGEHQYCHISKDYIDKKFPGRHNLILGDSTETIPDFVKHRPNEKFDLIFIDGGHTYDVARSDIENCKALATESTLVIIDDTIYNPDWIMGYSEGPTRAWLDAVRDGVIIERGRMELGPDKRGLSWGVYDL